MGWASGSSLLVEIWAHVRRHIKSEDRVDILIDLMCSFWNRDCDTIAEIIDPDWPETQTAYNRFLKEKGF